MATTTTNFGWDIPQSTDLVKDGATAIAALGQDIDTAFIDLKGGTTGQVLAKASNTDLDYSWVAQDDSNAIQNAIVDAKGDLIAATANDTPARLAVGTNGQVLTADSAAATGLAWATAASGSMTTLASGSLSGSALSLSSISGSYKNLQLIVRDLVTSNATDPFLRVNSDSTAGNYSVIGTNLSNTTASVTGDSTTRFYVFPTSASASDNNNVLYVNFIDYANTSSNKLMNSQAMFQASAGTQATFLACGYKSTSAITAISLTVGAGTFTGGTYILYGVN
jgi:hypothetical protein